MKRDPVALLKGMFLLGAVLDGAIALSWFLIAGGLRLPNILNGHTGAGADYRLAMYVGAMFMAGWTALLVWGALQPLERRGLLLITAMGLFLSVIVELAFGGSLLGGAGFLFGAAKRTLLGIMATAIYYSSFRADAPRSRA